MVKQHIIEELKVDFTQHLQGVKDQSALTIERGYPKSKLLVRLGRRYLSENDVKNKDIVVSWRLLLHSYVFILVYYCLLQQIINNEAGNSN